ncbi:MAG: PadR family transcriptional regulator [Candidatus Thermoplasmatota archaeon]|jgi:DNA-binding PadR family transcriptional regulator|nr:PadR family transcriptional regulator [Candidatus Thermoplasmatota archaeon]MCL5794108.1 PadR family transcriptional regulator [Candidatus Thermoplasmatota archaeon]
MLIQEKVLRGVISLLILRHLLEKPQHGYALQKEIETELKREMPDGAIYTLLKNLERRKLVKGESRAIVRGREIREYEITDAGREFLTGHLEPLRIVEEVIHSLIQDIVHMNAS